MIEINPEYVVLERTGAKEEIEALRSYLAQSGMLMQFTHSENIVLHDATVENALSGIIDRRDYLGD